MVPRARGPMGSHSTSATDPVNSSSLRRVAWSRVFAHVVESSPRETFEWEPLDLTIPCSRQGDHAPGESLPSLQEKSVGLVPGVVSTVGANGYLQGPRRHGLPLVSGTYAFTSRG